MTGTSLAPAPTSRPPVTPRPRGAVSALFRIEAVRLLRHPAVLTGLLLYLALWAYEWGTGGLAHRYPVLQDEDRYSQVPLLLVAAGAFIASNLALTRAQRSGVAAVTDLLALAPWRRTLAQLLAPLPLAMLSGLLVGARVAHLAAAPGAVGRPSLLELVTGPLIVLLAGVAGVAVGRLTSMVAVGPLVILGMAIFTLVGAVTLGRPMLKWWGLVAIEDEFEPPLPADLMHRPVTAHLVYLAACAAVCCAVALARSGVDRRIGVTAVGVTTVLAVVAGAGQSVTVPGDVAARRSVAEREPSAQQTCRTVGRVTYCAFRDFEGRIDQWSTLVGGMLGHTPPDRAADRYVVRQRLLFGATTSSVSISPPLAVWAADDARAGTPGAVPVGTKWGTDQIGGDAMLSFAGHFAARVVTGEPPTEASALSVCRSRAVLVLWLAATATEETTAALRSLLPRTGGSVVLPLLDSSLGLSIGRQEVSVVRSLLDRPADQVAQQVIANWAELTRPETGTERAASLLGTRVLGPAAEGARC
ncbi:hypothetical protein [Micromonospora sp. CV4]|uniref:hypothetical protein n=1 Tax=Micromonospora sp. CV4 TaxID=2478711 RepID=UPI000EF4C6EE|nr:hypothetical protein [Micromonospora sp. CV4]RLP93189.1 hypothetical protein EAD98_19560 [Micromonospora sp. CV4]